MGGNEHTHKQMDTSNSNLSAKIAIVATGPQLEVIRSDQAGAWLGDVQMVERELEQAVSSVELTGSDIVVLQADPSVPASMERVDAVKSLVPSASIVVAMEAATLPMVRRLVRAGVSDVVGLPFSSEEILQVLLAISEVRAQANTHVQRLAPLISVIGALGASGATTLITHLAAELGNRHEDTPNVCIIDLDIQFGHVTEVLGLTPRRTIAELLDSGDRLDASFFHSVAARHQAGVSVVAAPMDIGPVEAIDLAALDRVVQVARQEFEYVFVDLPSDLTNWALSLVARSDAIMLLTEQRVASLRQARRRIDLFKSLGLDMRRVSVVLNRAEKGLFKTISVGDVQAALGNQVSDILRLDEPHVALAQEQGLLVRDIRRKSAYGQDVEALAERLVARLANEDLA